MAALRRVRAALSAHQQLGRLVVVYDDNDISIEGAPRWKSSASKG
jgi:transketolase